VESYTSMNALPGRVERLEGLIAECGAGLDFGKIPELNPDAPPEIPLESESDLPGPAD
jgi:hypothetical protein